MKGAIVSLISCTIMFLVMEFWAHYAQLNVYNNTNNGYYLTQGLILLIAIISIVRIIIGIFKNTNKE